MRMMPCKRAWLQRRGRHPDPSVFRSSIAHSDSKRSHRRRHLVRFVPERVIMTGDFFRSVQYPNIDRANGGGLNGMINGLGQIIARSGPNTKIIPGHGPTVDRTAVVAHRDMMLAVRDRISKMIKE